MLIVLISKVRSVCTVYTDCDNIIYYVVILPIPTTAPSKAWVCGRLLAGVAGSNPAGRMDVCLSCVLSGRGL